VVGVTGGAPFFWLQTFFSSLFSASAAELVQHKMARDEHIPHQKGICAVCALPVLDNQPRTKNQQGDYVHNQCAAVAGLGAQGEETASHSIEGSGGKEESGGRTEGIGRVRHMTAQPENSDSSMGTTPFCLKPNGALSSPPSFVCLCGALRVRWCAGGNCRWRYRGPGAGNCALQEGHRLCGL
jgi:hypothetical protein